MKINPQVKKFKDKMSTPHYCSHVEIDEDSMLIGAPVFVELALQNK